jgi:hypothetical protein
MNPLKPLLIGVLILIAVLAICDSKIGCMNPDPFYQRLCLGFILGFGVFSLGLLMWYIRYTFGTTLKGDK